MIALITPTGRRPDQIRNCERWMGNQTYTSNILWCIVDDCSPSTIKTLGEGFGSNWNIVKLFPKPEWRSGQITQGRNILCALDTIEKFPEVKSIFIIEDDDYYSPSYLEEMTKRLVGYKVAGELLTIYYNVVSRTWIRNRNKTHVSLFQLVFTRDMIDLFKKSLQAKFIDMEFFNLLYKNKYEKDINLFKGDDYAIGIKGMVGRRGIGAGHVMNLGGRNDSRLKYLTEKIGNDASYYERYYIHYRGSRNKRLDKTGIRERTEVPPGRKNDNRRGFEPWK